MRLSVLGESDLEAGVLSPFNLCVELLKGVNSILVAWTINSTELLVGDLEA